MKRNISREQYELIFCKRAKITNRFPVYISEKTHHILKRTVANMGIFKLSISTLVENIITDHLETYTNQIKEIQDEEEKRLYPDENK